MGIELNIILAYAFGLILLYIVGYILLVPIKWIIKLVYNGIIGGVLLILINLVGGFFDFSIAINPITALVSGFLGIPGIILLVILKNIMA